MFEKWQKKINMKLRGDDDEDITFKKVSDDEPSAAPKAEDAAEENLGAVNVSASEAGKGALKIKTVNAESYGDVSKIADYLIDGYTVVLDTENVDTPTCVRMLDFLNGVTYTIDGFIKPTAKNSYLITPSGVDVSEEE